MTINAIPDSKHLLLSWFIGLRYYYLFKVASHVQQMLLLKSWQEEIQRFYSTLNVSEGTLIYGDYSH